MKCPHGSSSSEPTAKRLIIRTHLQAVGTEPKGSEHIVQLMASNYDGENYRLSTGNVSSSSVSDFFSSTEIKGQSSSTSSAPGVGANHKGTSDSTQITNNRSSQLANADYAGGGTWTTLQINDSKNLSKSTAGGTGSQLERIGVDATLQ